MPRSLVIATVLLLASVLALAGYAWMLKRRAEQTVARLDSQPLSPPVAGPSETVALYVAQDDKGDLQREDVSLALPSQPSERAHQVLHALVGEYLKASSPHAMAAGADVKSVYLLPNHLAVVDTTAAFADGHRSGVLVETLTIVSLVQTLTANFPEVMRVRFLVDGKERETLAGHADLSSFYDGAQVADLVKQLH